MRWVSRLLESIVDWEPMPRLNGVFRDCLSPLMISIMWMDADQASGKDLCYVYVREGYLRVMNLPIKAPMKNAACARPTLYSSPQMRPHSETVETPFPPTHSHKLGSMEQRDDEGVHDVDMSIRPALRINHKHNIVTKLKFM